VIVSIGAAYHEPISRKRERVAFTDGSALSGAGPIAREPDPGGDVDGGVAVCANDVPTNGTREERIGLGHMDHSREDLALARHMDLPRDTRECPLVVHSP